MALLFVFFFPAGTRVLVFALAFDFLAGCFDRERARPRVLDWDEWRLVFAHAVEDEEDRLAGAAGLVMTAAAT